MSSVDREPGRRDLVVFGLALPVAVALAGLLVGRHVGPTARVGVWAGGAAVVLLYAAVPAVRRPVFVGISRLTAPIGWAVSHLVLVLVFAVVVTPVALLLRLLGRDPLSRRPDPRVSTYWVERRIDPDPRRYFRQF
jgi:Saxitoxin biosynthesis operon protein SxtJ